MLCRARPTMRVRPRPPPQCWQAGWSRRPSPRPLFLSLVGFPGKQEPETALVGRVDLLLLHPHKPLQGQAPVLSHGHVQVLGPRRPRRSPYSPLAPRKPPQIPQQSGPQGERSRGVSAGARPGRLTRPQAVGGCRLPGLQALVQTFPPPWHPSFERDTPSQPASSPAWDEAQEGAAGHTRH